MPEITDLACRQRTLSGKIHLLKHLSADTIAVKVSQYLIDFRDKTHPLREASEDGEFFLIFRKDTMDQERSSGGIQHLSAHAAGFTQYTVCKTGKTDDVDHHECGVMVFSTLLFLKDLNIAAFNFRLHLLGNDNIPAPGRPFHGLFTDL